MVNIAEILKYCPKGTKLYSPICGDCTLEDIDLGETYSIEVISCSNGTHQLFTSKGAFLDDQKGAECLLFPSKDQRDWSKFRIPVKRGDIMMIPNSNYTFIAAGELYDNISPKYICGINLCDEFEISSDERGWTTDFYIPASKEAKEKLFKAIDDAGYKWDGKNLIKKEHQFKPFDKVLVRDSDEELWATAFYSHKVKGYYPYKTAGSIGFKQCIPFEGNEHLVGTSNSPK